MVVIVLRLRSLAAFSLCVGMTVGSTLNQTGDFGRARDVSPEIHTMSPASKVRLYGFVCGSVSSLSLFTVYGGRAILRDLMVSLLGRCVCSH